MWLAPVQSPVLRLPLTMGSTGRGNWQPHPASISLPETEIVTTSDLITQEAHLPNSK